MPTTEPLAYGPTRNPWDTDAQPRRIERRIGGRGRVRAWCPSAHAGDGGGSIRIPSSACGLFGLKPTRGRVSFGPDDGRELGRPRRPSRRHPVGPRQRGACSTCSQGSDAGRPVHRAAARRARTPTRSAPIPGSCASALRTDAPGGAVPRPTPTAWPRPRTRPRLLESLGHTVETASPAALDEADLMGMFLTILTHVGRRTTSSTVAADAPAGGHRRRLRAAHLGVHRARPDVHGRRSTSRPSLNARTRWSRRVASWWAERASTSCSRRRWRAPAGARRPRPPGRRPARGRGAGDAVRGVHARRSTSPGSRRCRCRCTGTTTASRSASSSSRRTAARTCCSASPRSSRPRAVGRPPAARPRLTATVTRPHRRRPGLLRRHAARGRRAARRGRRLPLPRGAGGADARDPAEGPPTRRDRAATPATSRATWRAALPCVADGRTKVITNAGGINPTAAARAAIATARAARASPGIKIATVLGDDLLGAARRRCERRTASLAHLDTGAPFERAPGRPRCSRPRTSAPARSSTRSTQGADIVITGRVADASLFLAAARARARLGVGRLGPARRRHRSSATCSSARARVSGGNYSGDWWTIPHPWDLPYPIAEVDADGTAVITKPAARRAAGSTSTPCATSCSTRCTIPPRTSSPDVVADFTSARRSTTSPTTACASTGVRGTPGDADLQGAARLPRRLGGRGPRRVLVARRAREGEGDRRDPRQAGRDGRPRGRRVARRVLGRRRARRADRATPTDGGAARVRAARRVALRRPADRRPRRTRAGAAHACRRRPPGSPAWAAAAAAARPSCSASGRRSSTRRSSTRTSRSRSRRST